MLSVRHAKGDKGFLALQDPTFIAVCGRVCAISAKKSAHKVIESAETTPSLKTKNVTPHTFRHTIALHMIQSGNDITVVAAWLGHADIKTASIYVTINNEMKRKVLEAFPPPTAPQTKGPNEPLWHDPPILAFLNDLSRKGTLCGVEKQKSSIAANQMRAHFT